LVKASTEEHAAGKVQIEVAEGEKKGAVEKRTDIGVGCGRRIKKRAGADLVRKEARRMKSNQG